MGDEADRLVGARPQFQQLLVEVVAHDLVERAERLVHQQQIGVEGERAGDRGALLHAARELPGIFLLEAGEVDELQRALDARLLLCRLEIPMISSGSATLRSMVRHGNSAGAWKT